MNVSSELIELPWIVCVFSRIVRSGEGTFFLPAHAVSSPCTGKFVTVRRATCCPTIGWKRREPGALFKCWAQCSDLRHGRDQVVKGPYVLAGVRCLTNGSLWPRSGAEQWLLRVGDGKSCNAGTDSRVSRHDVGGRWRETDMTRTV